MNLSIDWAVEFSHVWLRAMGHASVEGGIALLLVWIICRSVTRLPARARCWLWRLAYLKLAIALAWTTPVELRVLRPHQVHSAAEFPPPLAGFANPVRAHLPDQSAPMESAPIHWVLATSAPVPQAPHLQSTDLLALSALGLWTLIVVGLFLRLYMQWRTTQRFRHTCVTVTDSALKHLCTTLAEKLGLHVCPSIMSCNQNVSPLLLGILQPVIVLPASMLNAPSDELRLMLSHELAHLARRDLSWNLFSTVIEALFFFHPLIWLARRENRLAQEMAADHAALALTSTPPASYGQTLLEVAGRGWAPRLPLTAGVVTSRKTLERRLIAMRHLPHWTRRNLAVAGIGIGFVAAVGLPSWKLVAQPVPKNSETRPVLSQGVNIRQDDAKLASRAETFPATLRGGENVIFHVQALTDGVIREIHGSSGEFVAKGAVALVLDDRRVRGSLELAELKAEHNRQNLAKVKDMFEKKVVGIFDISNAQLDLKMAELELVARQQDLEDTRVQMPASGWLQNPQHQVGEFVTRGTAVVDIVSLANHCTFEMPASSASGMVIGQKLEYRSDKGVVYNGTVISMNQRGTAYDPVNVTARIINETKSKISSGAGQVTLHFDDQPESKPTSAPTVPSK